MLGRPLPEARVGGGALGDTYGGGGQQQRRQPFRLLRLFFFLWTRSYGWLVMLLNLPLLYNYLW